LRGSSVIPWFRPGPGDSVERVSIDLFEIV
jgi:hypothetical protein